MNGRSTANKPYIIAEAGTNHNGDAATARRLIAMARAAGADSVKFQIIYPEGLYVPAFYSPEGPVPNSVLEERRRFMLNDEAYPYLAAYAREMGLDFSASVFDENGLGLLLGCNPAYIKVASCDLNNIPFLLTVVERAAERKVRVMLSTGMSTLSEIEASLSAIAKTGFTDLVLLHCVSVYPASPSRMNLGFIDTLRAAFGLPVGFSDHTGGWVCAVAALARGACYFEKHVTEDRRQVGFDHAHAAEKEEFAGYVRALREAWEALGGHAEKVGEEEAKVSQRARRSLYAARPIAEGELIGEGDVLIVRPTAHLGPDQLDVIKGKRAKRSIMEYEPFTQDMVS